jgi:hypothetical protein
MEIQVDLVNNIKKISISLKPAHGHPLVGLSADHGWSSAGHLQTG